jgi:hypothetical protein
MYLSRIEGDAPIGLLTGRRYLRAMCPRKPRRAGCAASSATRQLIRYGPKRYFGVVGSLLACISTICTIVYRALLSPALVPLGVYGLEASKGSQLNGRTDGRQRTLSSPLGRLGAFSAFVPRPSRARVPWRPCKQTRTVSSAPSPQAFLIVRVHVQLVQLVSQAHVST